MPWQGASYEGKLFWGELENINTYVLLKIVHYLEPHTSHSGLFLFGYGAKQGKMESVHNLISLNSVSLVTPTFNFQSIRIHDPGCWYKFTNLMTNSADPDQLASGEANWSGSTLFAITWHIRVQQFDQCLHCLPFCINVLDTSTDIFNLQISMVGKS